MTRAGEPRPLAGVRVLVTRRGDRASGFADLLRAEGAVPIEVPVLAIRPAADVALDAALDALAGARWVLFTSASGVDVLARHARTRARTALPPGARLAAVGPATAAAIRREGWAGAFEPSTSNGAALGRELPALPGERIVALQAKGARGDVRDELEARGLTVEVHRIYETEPPSDRARASLEFARLGDVDCVTFTSGSTVEYLLEALRRMGDGAERALFETASVACIGPVTAERARELGLRPAIVAGEQTLAGLVDAMRRHFQSQEHGV